MHLAQVVLLCLAYSLSPAEALKGQQFPIPRNELYENYHGVATAETEDVHSVDYSCRYSIGRPCYCCGAFFHYIEQGRVCTKYCLKGAVTPGEPKFCQKRLIVLPLNWGYDSPDKITLDNGDKTSNIHIPYDSSAPTDCPQDPYMIHTEPKVPSMMPGNKPASGGSVTGSTTTIPAPAPATTTTATTTTLMPAPMSGNKWQSTDQSGQKLETPRSRPPVPTRKPKDRPTWSSHPRVKPARRGDDITTPTPSSSQPSTRRPSSISRPGRCPSGASCVPMGQCPTFLHERSAWRQLPRGSRAYTQALDGLKASVCDKRAQLVCCVGWS